MLYNGIDFQLGNIIYVADYQAKPKAKKKPVLTRKDVIKILTPRVLDNYWMAYLCNVGFDDATPVPLNNAILNKIPNFVNKGDYWVVRNEKFILMKPDHRYLFCVDGQKESGIVVRSLHQLQNLYQLVTASKLDLEQLFKFLRPLKLE